MSASSLPEPKCKIVVGIAELATSDKANATLATYSLGSCIGVSIYDPKLKVGGLLHVMLPDSSIDPLKASSKPAMFMDTALPNLFRAATDLRVDKDRAQICVVGGAQIMDSSGVFNIGKRNYEALVSSLKEQGLHIHAQQVGGHVSRSMSLRLATGEVRLKVAGQGDEIVLCKS
jgi:chemotaxis protein CheD